MMLYIINKYVYVLNEGAWIPVSKRTSSIFRMGDTSVRKGCYRVTALAGLVR